MLPLPSVCSFKGLNTELVRQVSRAGHQLLSVLGRADRIAIWTYGDTVNELANFSQVNESLDRIFFGLQPPDLSETNLYDDLLFALNRMRPVAGRKALILVSSGVDTFSKATFEDVLAAARDGGTPVYVINAVGDDILWRT